MTEEELDLLASAYVDGEATPEETRLVDSDPALQQRVASMRSISNRVSVTTPISAEVKERHIGAALAAFVDATDGSTADGPKMTTVPTDKSAPSDNVDTGYFDLDNPDNGEQSDTGEADNVIQLGSRQGRGGTNQLVQSRSRNRMPHWLSTAAAAVVVVGGGLWMVSQGGSDTTDTAAELTAEVQTADDSESAPAPESDGDAEDADDALAQGTGADDDEANEAMADEAMADSAEETDEPSSAEETPVTTVAELPESTSTAGDGGFFPTEPAKTYETVPAAEQVAEDLADALQRDVSRSNCNGDLLASGEVETFLGYAPVLVEGKQAEFFLVRSPAGEEVGILVDNSCNQLTS